MNEKFVEVEECKLCVIGTGVAGLNALYSSSQYLSDKDKIIVVDKRERKNAIGGMWNSAYDFVRLHQPHKLFTVGNKKWDLNKNPSHLAKRNEILKHFQNCYRQLMADSFIVEKFGYEYQSHEEVKTVDGYEVHIHFEATDESSPPLLVKAERCIKAIGFDISPKKPLEISATKVRSITPETPALLDGEVADDGKPIYIVGGGKTSMDVANLLIAQHPKRKLNFIVGRGTFFLNRDVLFPSGIKKNWQGVPLNKSLLDIVLHYDGQNLESAIEYVKQAYCSVPFEKAKYTLLGVLSPEESRIVKKGINSEIYEYLEDVKEESGELFLNYRSGQKQKIEPGSWLINCGGHLYSGQEAAEPILSPHGKVLSIQKTASAFVFTSFAGYFLPHLWFRNQFEAVPINQFNHSSLIKKDKEVFVFAIAAQVIQNLIYSIDALPFHVVYKCGLNFDKWFPLHRQVPFLLDVLRNKRKYLDHTTKILEDIDKKYGVDNGVVGQ